MSLHNASKYLASKGRKGDTELVHMSKGEVRGLQQLALAHGGSLTINPETGLAEAGILKSVLPMVAGAALTVATGGTALAAYAPLMAAAMAGGGMYAATGSVKEGVLAGLGAYGGASLAGGLAEAGATAASEEAVAAETSRQAGLEAAEKATAEAAGKTVGEESTRQMGLNAAEEAAQNTAKMDAMTREGLTFNQQANILQGPGQTGAPYGYQLQGADAFKNIPGAQYSDIVQQGTKAGMTTQEINNSLAMANASQTGQNMSTMSQMGKGLPQIGNVVMENPKAALATAAPLLMGSSSGGGAPQQSQEGSNPFGLATLSPNFQGYTPPQPDPYYQARYTDYAKKRSAGLPGYSGYAEGGVVGLAGGGMDPMNPMQNAVYPQSQQEHTNFATSSQYPNSMQSAMGADYDVRTNPTTGQELPMGMADGGVASYEGGGIGAIRRMQPGGKWGNLTADLYGVVDKNAPWLTDMQPGGAMGALQPGRMDYEDRQRAEEEAKQAEIDAQNAEVAKKKATQDSYDRFNRPAGGMQAMQAFQSYASGGVIGMASGTPRHLPSSPSMPAGGIYRDTDPDTANKDAYNAALIRLQKVNKAAGTKGLTMPKAAMTQLGGAFDSVEDKAGGGIAHYNLGGYSDGGRMLKGPGDGMSDSIPASIGGKQAARLADGEFVVPADVVSHLGNGSTDAGAKKLYGMMDKVRHARTGTKKQGKQIKADKYLPK
jgi:hypothetical protein